MKLKPKPTKQFIREHNLAWNIAWETATRQERERILKIANKTDLLYGLSIENPPISEYSGARKFRDRLVAEVTKQ